jgi:cytidylate kinase
LKKLVIAIDGPAASGKSTTAKLTSKKLGYLFVDTGAMYRAMTLKMLEKNIDLHDEKAVIKVAQSTEIKLHQVNGELRVLLDKEDVTRSIRSQAVTKAVSAISAMKPVREVMVREQRRIGEQGGVVLEGRDIGTVVFPHADLKIYMVANVEERAKRRQKELARQGVEVSSDELLKDILERDQKDSKRDVSPLCKADDAIILDTSHVTIEEQVDFIVEKANAILKSRR